MSSTGNNERRYCPSALREPLVGPGTALRLVVVCPIRRPRRALFRTRPGAQKAQISLGHDTRTYLKIPAGRGARVRACRKAPSAWRVSTRKRKATPRQARTGAPRRAEVRQGRGSVQGGADGMPSRDSAAAPEGAHAVLRCLALHTAKAGALSLACAPSGLRARPAGDFEIGSTSSPTASGWPTSAQWRCCLVSYRSTQ
jgi:hypothetical protein